MSNQQPTISNVQDLITYLDAYEETGRLFRGQGNAAHLLIPSLYRYADKAKARGFDLDVKEKNALSILRAELPLLHKTTPTSDLELKALAQHHGLPTRLLDWSLSPLTALLFAVQNPGDHDAALFMLRGGSLPWHYDTHYGKPDDMPSGSFIFMPRHITSRLRAQRGVFTFHPDASPFEHAELQKFIIPKGRVGYIRFQLLQLGIDEKLIYDDLDGLCNDLNFRNFKGF